MFNLLAVWCVLPPPCPDNQRGSGASIRLPGDSGDRWLQGSQGLSGTVTQMSWHYANITISQSFYYKCWTAQGPLSSPTDSGCTPGAPVEQGQLSRLLSRLKGSLTQRILRESSIVSQPLKP